MYVSKVTTSASQMSVSCLPKTVYLGMAVWGEFPSCGGGKSAVLCDGSCGSMGSRNSVMVKVLWGVQGSEMGIEWQGALVRRARWGGRKGGGSWSYQTIYSVREREVRKGHLMKERL